MVAAPFRYERVTSFDEAVRALRERGEEAKVIAGGQSLVPMLNLRVARPDWLIDINPVGAGPIEDAGGQLRLPALTRHRALERAEVVRRRCPILAAATACVGNPRSRTRGTIGGSLAHADPGGDLPAAVLALDAEIALRGPNGERTVKADDFFQGLLTSDVGEDEVLTEVRVKRPAERTGTAYAKFPNPASGYAVVGIAAAVTLGADGTVTDARIGVTGTGDHAVRATAAENALKGQRLTPETIAAAANLAADGIDPLEDIHASADYRAQLTKVFAKRALERAGQRAGA